MPFSKTNGGDWVSKTVETATQSYTVDPYAPYRRLTVSVEDGEVVNDGTDSEQVTVEVVSNQDVLEGTAPSTVSEDGDATLLIDGSEVTVSLTGGSGSTSVTSTLDAGSIIEIEATGRSTSASLDEPRHDNER